MELPLFQRNIGYSYRTKPPVSLGFDHREGRERGAERAPAQPPFTWPSAEVSEPNAFRHGDVKGTLGVNGMDRLAMFAVCVLCC